MSTEAKILLSRLLTRSGDQAWSFAVPIVLIQVLSGHSQAVFAYFFLTFLGGFLLMPYVGRMIDRSARKRAIQVGIIGQLLGVGLAYGAMRLIARYAHISGQSIDPAMLGLIACLLGASLIGNLGSSMTDIAIASDIAPSIIPPERLASFNSRLRQLDLFTEVASPIAAGILLASFDEKASLWGFGLIALWNILSFFPEYFLIQSVLLQHPSLLRGRIDSRSERPSVPAKLLAGWSEFKAQPIAVVMICYSLLWLSVLSPHGVLLTAFLKNGWQLSESVIGIFRGLGAIFGLIATLLYPWVVARYQLLDGAKKFICFQALTVAVAVPLFFIPANWAKFGFLLLILLSRIGLYGFSLAEGQMRQIHIPEGRRGTVNGTATALNNLATLLLLGLGTLFSSPDTFFVLVLVSCAAVLFAAIAVATWRPPSSVTTI